jgi:hypothetical protein
VTKARVHKREARRSQRQQDFLTTSCIYRKIMISGLLGCPPITAQCKPVSLVFACASGSTPFSHKNSTTSIRPYSRCPQEASLQLRFCCIRFQTAIFVEEAFDDIEPPHSSSARSEVARRGRFCGSRRLWMKEFPDVRRNLNPSRGESRGLAMGLLQRTLPWIYLTALSLSRFRQSVFRLPCGLGRSRRLSSLPHEPSIEPCRPATCKGK